MPVELENIAGEALLPRPPRLWLWLLLMVVLLIIAVAYAALFVPAPLSTQGSRFWAMVIGAPLAVWGLLGVARLVVHIGQRGVAEGWNQARANDLHQHTQRGRRFVQVLATTAQSALREPGVCPSVQLSSLLDGVEAFKSQPDRLKQKICRNSQLPATHRDLEVVLNSALTDVLADLTNALNKLPEDVPLAFLFEVNSGVPERRVRKVWTEAWKMSGFRKSLVPCEGQGMAALDAWLDRRTNDGALLLVVAIQFAAERADHTAEAVAGLLLGNPLRSCGLPAIARLHRPEQIRTVTADVLPGAVHQALGWGNVDTDVIEHTWVAGIDPERKTHGMGISTTAPGEVLDLDAALGQAGPAAPWLAIALATQTLQLSAAPQLILAGASPVNNGHWAVALTPASTV